MSLLLHLIRHQWGSCNRVYTTATAVYSTVNPRRIIELGTELLLHLMMLLHLQTALRLPLNMLIARAVANVVLLDDVVADFIRLGISSATLICIYSY